MDIDDIQGNYKYRPRPVGRDDPLTARVGHHFAEDIVMRATGALGLEGHQNKIQHGHGAVNGNYRQQDYYWKSRGWNEDGATDEQRATVFRDAMKELFPQMPDQDVKMVLTRALFKVSCCYQP